MLLASRHGIPQHISICRHGSNTQYMYTEGGRVPWPHCKDSISTPSNPGCASGSASSQLLQQPLPQRRASNPQMLTAIRSAPGKDACITTCRCWHSPLHMAHRQPLACKVQSPASRTVRAQGGAAVQETHRAMSAHKSNHHNRSRAARNGPKACNATPTRTVHDRGDTRSRWMQVGLDEGCRQTTCTRKPGTPSSPELLHCRLAICVL
jgi:hypothetical protein